MKKNNYLLSVSLLSQSFIEKLEKQAGQTYQTIVAARLRQFSGWKLFLYLRRIKADSLVIAIEDQESLLVLPILLLLAMIIPAKSRGIYLPTQEFAKFNGCRALFIIFKFFIQSVWTQITRWFFLFRVKKYYKNAEPSTLIPNGKKILYINENLWFGLKGGGSVGHVAGVINELYQQNYEVFYAAVTDNQQINQQIPRLPLPCIDTFAYPNELNYHRFSNLTIKYLREWIKKNKPSIIYQRLSIGNYAGAVLSKEFSIPLVLEYNGSEVWCFEKWGAGLKYKTLPVLAEKLNLKQAAYIVTVSEILHEDLKNQGVPTAKIIVYPNCIDPDIFNPQRFRDEDLNNLRHQYHIPVNAVILSFIGTFGKWHGAENLARSIKYLIDFKSDWLDQHKIHFLLIGDGSQMPAVQAILNNTGDHPLVTFTGIIPQHLSPLYLAASNIVLSPHVPNADGSRFFGSPTKLFEYMAMGKGIIASNIEQIGDVLKNSLHVDQLDQVQNPEDKLAILCKPGSTAELSQAMMFLVENPQIRTQLGMNARKAALNSYTWQKHVDNILKSIYKPPRSHVIRRPRLDRGSMQVCKSVWIPRSSRGMTGRPGMTDYEKIIDFSHSSF